MATTRIAQRERAQRALQLRAMGATWQRIADDLGYRSRQAAHMSVKTYLAQHQPDPEAERGVTSETLRILQSTLFSRLVDANTQGDTDTVVKLSKELRSLTAESSRLNGLYRPAQTEHAVAVTVTPSPRDAIEEARRRTLEALNTNTIDAEVVEP
ncbi:hypothetical protein ACPXB3_01370 [Gordonia sp. DT219]|uniref:hypothetical protein n=1 Tax=Gordonia sp. DT219 TaxID=3416658 RepID=UPI003CF0C791